MGTATSRLGGWTKANPGGVAVLTVKAMLPVPEADPAAALRATVSPPAAVVLAAWKFKDTPAGGMLSVLADVVMPVGRLPSVSVPPPVMFTSEGCTRNEKLEFA